MLKLLLCNSIPNSLYQMFHDIEVIILSDLKFI